MFFKHGNWKDFFFYLPIEDLIQSRQKEYYYALNKADFLAECSCFVSLLLENIMNSLKEMTVVESITDQVSDQVTD